MELFFPLIGAAAIGIACLAAACCILIPSSKHLVSRVFFGTLAFLFGGVFFTFVVFIAFSISANAIAPAIHLPNVVGYLLFGFIFLLAGTGSARAALRIFEASPKSLGSKPKTNKIYQHPDGQHHSNK